MEGFGAPNPRCSLMWMERVEKLPTLPCGSWLGVSLLWYLRLTNNVNNQSVVLLLLPSASFRTLLLLPTS